MKVANKGNLVCVYELEPLINQQAQPMLFSLTYFDLLLFSSFI